MKDNNRKVEIHRMTMSAMFLAVGLVLPFLTGQIPQIGSMMLPMHIPVLVCGMVCGSFYGGVIGFILPILRYFLFGMPPLFPTGLAMAFELAAYGIISGRLYYSSKWKCYRSLYYSLILAMIGGRVVWGVVYAVLAGVSGQSFTIALFLAGAFFNAIPGIIVQLLFVPMLVKVLNKTNLIPMKENKTSVV